MLACCGESQEPTEIEPSGLFERARAKPGKTVVLVVGDSLSVSLADKLETVLDKNRCTLERLCREGGGLTRPELLDFPAGLKELLGRTTPDVVVFMIGANDAMPVTNGDAVRVPFDSPEWRTAYAGRVGSLIQMALAANPRAPVFWVGAPPMADRNLSSALRRVNAAQREACQGHPPCRFLDTWEVFSDAEDAYTSTALDLTGAQTPLRTADGVHLTDAGARRLCARVVSETSGVLPVPASKARDELFSSLTDLTPVPLATASPAPGPSKAEKKHEVKRGETLAGIARAHGLSTEALIRANQGVDAKKLRPGQTLVVPAPDTAP
ncbi:MAG: GDSL-type esterase/lipase family protein [Thermodesulfobacteriota bacterium]